MSKPPPSAHQPIPASCDPQQQQQQPTVTASTAASIFRFRATEGFSVLDVVEVLRWKLLQNDPAIRLSGNFRVWHDAENGWFTFRTTFPTPAHMIAFHRGLGAVHHAIASVTGHPIDPLGGAVDLSAASIWVGVAEESAKPPPEFARTASETLLVAGSNRVDRRTGKRRLVLEYCAAEIDAGSLEASMISLASSHGIGAMDGAADDDGVAVLGTSDVDGHSGPNLGDDGPTMQLRATPAASWTVVKTADRAPMTEATTRRHTEDGELVAADADHLLRGASANDRGSSWTDIARLSTFPEPAHSPASFTPAMPLVELESTTTDGDDEDDAGVALDSTVPGSPPPAVHRDHRRVDDHLWRQINAAAQAVSVDDVRAVEETLAAGLTGSGSTPSSGSSLSPPPAAAAGGGYWLAPAWFARAAAGGASAASGEVTSGGSTAADPAPNRPDGGCDSKAQRQKLRCDRIDAFRGVLLHEIAATTAMFLPHNGDEKSPQPATATVPVTIAIGPSGFRDSDGDSRAATPPPLETHPKAAAAPSLSPATAAAVLPAATVVIDKHDEHRCPSASTVTTTITLPPLPNTALPESKRVSAALQRPGCAPRDLLHETTATPSDAPTTSTTATCLLQPTSIADNTVTPHHNHQHHQQQEEQRLGACSAPDHGALASPHHPRTKTTTATDQEGGGPTAANGYDINNKNIIAVKVALEGIAVRTFRCIRAHVDPPPQPGEALIVRCEQDGAVRVGSCVSIAAWSGYRKARGTGGCGVVLRRMTPRDERHLRTVVQPLAAEVLRLARHEANSVYKLPVELVSASCFFDCSSVLITLTDDPHQFPPAALAAAAGPPGANGHNSTIPDAELQQRQRRERHRVMRTTEEVGRGISDFLTPTLSIGDPEATNAVAARPQEQHKTHNASQGPQGAPLRIIWTRP